MIKGLAITPPILGRISIGRIIEKNGKRLPEKDDQFTLTSQVQNKNGWLLHPLDEELRKSAPTGKLRSIPVRMLFNDPDLNLRAEYSAFDRQTGRPLCVGNGETCRRFTPSGMQTLPCPSPTLCDFGQGGVCKPYGRLNVRIVEDDELGTFVFRTTGFNSIRTLAARLSYYQAISGDLLSCLPLQLRLRGKSTTLSHRSAIFYVDLTIREGMTLEQAMTDAKAMAERRREVGLDQVALDAAARTGFSNAAFEYSDEEIPEVMDEFYARDQGEPDETVDDITTANPVNRGKAGLREKLERKAQGQQSTG